MTLHERIMAVRREAQLLYDSRKRRGSDQSRDREGAVSGYTSELDRQFAELGRLFTQTRERLNRLAPKAEPSVNF
jgi:hypothetical protein